MALAILNDPVFKGQGDQLLSSLLLTLITFNPSMDKQSHISAKCGMELLIISYTSMIAPLMFRSG